MPANTMPAESIIKGLNNFDVLMIQLEYLKQRLLLLWKILNQVQFYK